MLLSRIVILKGMTGALAPFSCLVYYNSTFHLNTFKYRMSNMWPVSIRLESNHDYFTIGTFAKLLNLFNFTLTFQFHIKTMKVMRPLNTFGLMSYCRTGQRVRNLTKLTILRKLSLRNNLIRDLGPML
jgi:hypothetical protein